MVPMQPDRCRRSHPAARAWLVRMAAGGLLVLATSAAAVELVGRALSGWLHPELAGLVTLAVAVPVGLVGGHVVTTLLRDRMEAAWRELDSELAEIRRRYGPDGGSDDGA